MTAEFIYFATFLEATDQNKLKNAVLFVQTNIFIIKNYCFVLQKVESYEKF